MSLDAGTRRTVTILAVCAVIVLALGITVGVLREGGEAGADGPAVALAEPLPMPDAVLTNTDGTPYDLRTETAGKATLLYFGYTHCPDACPIQLKVLADVMKTLQPDVRDQLEVVFITTDPGRDTPEIMRAYLDQFDSTFIGLTGTDSELQDLQIAAGLPVAVAEPMDENGGYIIGHATQVLAFGPDGNCNEVFPLGVRESDWAAALPGLVGVSS